MYLNPIPKERQAVSFMDGVKGDCTSPCQCCVDLVDRFFVAPVATGMRADDAKLVNAFIRHRAPIHFKPNRMSVSMRVRCMRNQRQEGKVVRPTVVKVGRMSQDAAGSLALCEVAVGIEFHSCHKSVAFIFGVPELIPVELSIKPFAVVAVLSNSNPSRAHQVNVAR